LYIPENLQVDQIKTASVRNAKPPRSRTELFNFLGLCNVYRRFNTEVSQPESTLTNMLKKNITEPFQWDQQMSEAFEGLKNKVRSPPVLVLPTLKEELVLYTDSTDELLGCCRQQRGRDGHLHPLEYW
jgi:RNase H-like domain found in reverse transcriptase